MLSGRSQASQSADANWYLYVKLNQVIFGPNRSKSQPYVHITYTHTEQQKKTQIQATPLQRL